MSGRKRARLVNRGEPAARFVLHDGEWLAMQSNVPVEDLKDREPAWGEGAAVVVRNAVAAKAENLLDTITAMAREFKVLVEEAGPCDHSVGICSCGLRAILEEAEDLLESTPPASVAAREDPDPYTNGRGRWVARGRMVLEEEAGAGGGPGLVATCELEEDASWIARTWNWERSGKG